LLKFSPRSAVRRTPRTPATPAVASARRFAAQIRVALAAVGTLLLFLEPALHPRPVLAALGLAILAITGLLHGADLPERWLRLEEALACSAGVLLVTLGTGRVDALTLVWVVSAAVGVVARGGRVGNAGRLFVVAVLASPMLRVGATADTVSLLASGLGLLLAVGRISAETSELLRDPLTGALSRGAFDAQLERLAAHAEPHRPMGVIMIDLDDFGRVNKQRGHRAGDLLLISVVETITATLRGHDVLGRVGGDEFAVLAIGEQPEVVARRIVDALQAADVSASAGVARSPRDGTLAPMLMAAADVALRLSKRDGKRRVSSYEGPRLTGLDADGAGDALRRLCAGEGIAIALQPILDLDADVIHAFEALARFDVRESDEGPMAWFALADRAGCRRELERACLRAALPRLSRLPGEVGMTVNLSPDMIDDPDVLALVEGAHGTDRLIVEVTERQAVLSDAQVRAAIARMRACGVRFAVDDVGSGHAGLGQLAVVRPEYLKLDRSMVRGMSEAPDRALFVHSLAEFVRSSQTRIVAEGIETHDDLRAVRAAGIDLGQGYLLGRPQLEPRLDLDPDLVPELDPLVDRVGVGDRDA